jgi:hypothetical protein
LYEKVEPPNPCDLTPPFQLVGFVGHVSKTGLVGNPGGRVEVESSEEDVGSGVAPLGGLH